MGKIESVYVTGTFDGWSKSQRMVRAVDGEHWEKTVELKREKISYKVSLICGSRALTP